MENYFRHELKQNENGEYEIVIFLDNQMEEFANELGGKVGEQTDFLSSVRNFVQKRYPKLKVSVVKVVIGGIAVSTIPFFGGHISAAEAAQAPSPTWSEVSNDQAIYYHVSSGDTLWGLANKYNTSVGDIKQANHLVSDTLTVDQRLIIPKYFHTVEKGDTLYSIARENGISVDAIKVANGMNSDILSLGRIIIIPTSFGNQNAVGVGAEQTQNSYTVVAGDSLWTIANHFHTTINTIKDANNLSTDMLKVGQQLTIPTGNNNANPIVETQVPTTANVQYTVVAGDSLWVISQKYGVSVDAIRSSNNLDSDNLSIGQKLIIPKEDGGVLAPALTPAQGTTTANYTVGKGDTLYSIANRFGVSVDSLKSTNQLTSNTITIGQVLTISKGAVPVSSDTNVTVDNSIRNVQGNLQKLGYYAVATMTGNYDNATTSAIKEFQADYGLTVTGKADTATSTTIEHAVIKHELIKDTQNYLGVPYLWGGTTPSGFDCSGFVYFMFNKHDVNMPRNTSAGLYTQGKAISESDLQPGDLVFYSLNSSGSITHVGFYIGDNQWISATSSKGIAVYSMDNSYWSKYYVGAKRIY